MKLLYRILRSCRDCLAISIIIFFDLFALTGSMFCAYFIRDHLLFYYFPAIFSSKLLAHTFELFWWYPFIFIFCLAYEKLYHRRLPYWIEVYRIFKAGILALALTFVILYLVRLSNEISRSLIILTWLFAMFLIPVFRYFGKKLLIKFNLWLKPVIIIGNSATIPLMNSALQREATMGYRAIGCIDSANNLNSRANNYPFIYEPQSGLTCLGPLNDAETIVKSAGVNDLIITDLGFSSSELVTLINRLQLQVNNVILVPDLFGISLSGIEIAYFFEEQAVLLQIKNSLKSKTSQIIKRTFDLTVGLLIHLISLPVLLGISLAIKIDSKGPVLYVSERIGRGGSHFKCFKFRTMHTDADYILIEYLAQNSQARYEWQYYNKLILKDPRVTRVGRFLRRFSLDELPQLFNIFLGEMSLVGPRPYLPREQEQMGTYANFIIVGKPGLTGLWQVSGRNNLVFESRLKLDSWYIKNWSLWLDMILLIKTIRVVLKGYGAY